MTTVCNLLGCTTELKKFAGMTYDKTGGKFYAALSDIKDEDRQL
jgi:hypothetical protein